MEEKIEFLKSLGFVPVSDNLTSFLEVKCLRCNNTFKRAFIIFKQGATKCPHCEKEEKIRFLNSLGFTPISEDLNMKLEVKCEEGHTFKRAFGDFKKGATKCPICEKEEKVEFLSNLGFIPVSKDLDKKLEVRCEKGHVFKRGFNNFKKGATKCPVCEREGKIKFYDRSLSSKLEFKCKKGHTFKRAFDSFKQDNANCPICEREEKLEFLNSLGFTPVSKSLGDGLEVKCRKGHTFKRVYTNFKNGATSCPICEKEEKLKFLNNLGFAPISKNLSDYLEVRCLKCNNTFKRTFGSFKQGVTSCPICEKEEKIKFLNSLGFISISKDLSDNLEVKCKKGHIFKRTFGSFKQDNANCPICEKEEKIEFLNGLGFTLISEDLGVDLEVKCKKGHTFKRVFGSFKQGATKCPICEKEEKVEFLNGLGFTLVSEDLNIELEVKCEKGHTFKRAFGTFKRNVTSCPVCEKEEKIEFLNSLGFTSISEDLGDNLEVRCEKGHTFKRAFSSFKQQGSTKCPICFPNSSSIELEVKKFLGNLNIEYIHSDWNIITPQELDFYIPSHNLAIEFDGIYWHSELQGKGKDYHLSKTEKCLNKNINLLHIFENEWVDPVKQSIWKSIIKDRLGLNEKIYANECVLKQVSKSEEEQFLEENHLQGYIDSQVAFGLYYKDKLVSLMSFGKSNFSFDVEWELLRFANKQNIDVVDGELKLFKHFRSNFEGGVVSYSDRRYSIDSIYKELGFQFLYNSEPNYFYFKNSGILESSQKYIEHNLPNLLEKFDPNLTEYENMVNNGYNRIWDCGSSVWKIV
jgi:hypothetical protein